MSAIFGLVYLDGRPVAWESLEAMRSAIASWGPDGIHTCHAGSAGLGFASLAVTPESQHEIMPLHDSERRIFLVTAARLDNRDELCALFGIPSADRATTPDGHLVMRAFQRWEADCPRYLYGDWAYAAWNDRKRELMLARDQLGNTGLYYSYLPPLFAFASDPEALFAGGTIQRQIHEMRLACFLTYFEMEDPSETFFLDIKRLLPAHSLFVNSKGLRADHYWRLENFPAIHPSSDAACLEGFIERYRAAVDTRLRSARPIGISLSSGLDSGSAAALAAESLNCRGQKLIAFTSVPMHPADHLVPGARADEWPLAHAIAERYPNIEHLPVRAEKVTPVAGIMRALSISRMPIHAAVNAFWIIALLEEAQRHGLGVLLNGQMGNGGISWSGGRDRILHLWMQGNWDRGLRELAKWKAHRGYSWFRTIKHHILRPLLNPLWSQRGHILRPFDPPWAGMAAINPAFADRLRLLRAMKDQGYDTSFSKPIAPLKERRLTLFRNCTAAGPIWHAFGSAFGLEVRDPTADTRLLEYCLGLPDDPYVCNGGERMLLRRAMEGRLPPQVQWNTRRGKQAADVAFRLLDQVEEVNTLLDRLAASPAVADTLDIDAMRRAWRDIRTGPAPGAAFRAESLLLRGIMTGLFVESMEPHRL